MWTDFKRQLRYLFPSAVAVLLTASTFSPAAGPLTITEISFRCATATREYDLSLDPGYTDVALYSQDAFRVYAHSLPDPAAIQLADIKLADLVNDPSRRDFFQLADVGSHTGFVSVGDFILHTRDDRWFRVVDAGCGIPAVYFQKERNQASGPYYMITPISDVLFWSAKHREIYREGALGLGKKMSELRWAHIDGNYDPGRYIYPDVPFKPSPARQGKYHSTTDELCYHFENCSWACMVQ